MSAWWRRLICWLRNNHRWEQLEDHHLCTRCWVEWDEDEGLVR